MLKAYPAKHYVEQHSEVLKLSAELDDRTKTIAEYWADGPGTAAPPGHWNVIAQYVSRRDSHDLDRDVKLLFVLNNTMMDSGIAAWDVKRYYDSIRPISAIRFLYAGKQVQAWGGPLERPQDRRRDVAHTSRSTAVRRVRLGTQRRQQCGGGCAQVFHRQQRLRRHLDAASRCLANRAGPHAEQTGYALMGDLYASRPRGWDVAALRRHPHL